MYNCFCNYRISLNRCHPRIVATQSDALERNEHWPRIVATASKRGMHTHVRMISDNAHHTRARTVCVVRVLPTAESGTERLHVLLTVSSNHHRLTRTYILSSRH